MGTFYSFCRGMAKKREGRTMLPSSCINFFKLHNQPSHLSHQVPDTRQHGISQCVPLLSSQALRTTSLASRESLWPDHSKGELSENDFLSLIAWLKHEWRDFDFCTSRQQSALSFWFAALLNSLHIISVLDKHQVIIYNQCSGGATKAPYRDITLSDICLSSNVYAKTDKKKSTGKGQCAIFSVVREPSRCLQRLDDSLRCATCIHCTRFCLESSRGLLSACLQCVMGSIERYAHE